MSIIDAIKQFVEKECKKPTSAYGYEPFPFHLIPTVNYAQQLCNELGGDKEIIILAAWLHDIGSIRHGRKDHHINGAKIAKQKLTELNYPPKKIEHICTCIHNHRGSLTNERKTIEEKIIADADTMSAFDNLSGLFKAAFTYENLTQDNAQKSVLKKLTNKYNKLHFEQSKKIIKPKFKAAKLLLS